MLSVLISRITEAIQHFKYGITHDIYKEPVLSYAKLAISALEKTIPTPVEKSQYGIYFCPKCHGSVWQCAVESKYCFRCGQRLDFSYLDRYKIE